MFARVMHLQAKLENLDEITALYRGFVEPHLQTQHGFINSLLLTDPCTGRGMSITLWDSEADQLSSDNDGHFLLALGKVAPLLEAPPKKEDFIAEAPTAFRA